MSSSLTRRAAIARALLAAPALCQRTAGSAFAADTLTRLAELERINGGRLGVAVLDVATKRKFAQRGDERFALCSTFKLLAAGFVLARVDRGQERLDRRITFSKSDLVEYSPVTSERTNTGMTLAELCEAALTISDNTAGNLLLASFGGPPALTSYIRTLGDPVTRLDRIEVALNEARPGDPRDTTTPSAMLEDVRQLVLGNALSTKRREQLAKWLVANKTGDARLRAGFPKRWRIGDKTGAGEHGATNDVAVAWRPGRAPLIVSAYYGESAFSSDRRNAVLANVARIVADAS
jgi:beta-lactamase class A